MKNFYLDFEKPISDIMDKIEALKIASEDDPKLIPEIEKLKTKEKNLRKKNIFKTFNLAKSTNCQASATPTHKRLH